MKIVIIGCGYVGLVSGACFAEMGNEVVCLDIDEEKILMLQKGVVPFYEPGLEELVLRNHRAHRLIFTTNYKDALPKAAVVFLALPTPSNPDGSANLDATMDACNQIALHLDQYLLIVNKSTAPVGTSFKIKHTIQRGLDERAVAYPFDVAANPEFLKEGDAVSDCLRPDRIIIGTENEKAAKILRKIYTGFIMSKDRLIEMDIRSAELTKYAANAMLACRISFMNELADICESFGVNIHNIRKGIGSDSRIGHQFLYAGAGFGGSCFPKDLKALISMAEHKQISTPLLASIQQVNTGQKRKLAQKIVEYFEKKGGLQSKTIAIWGLSFKPGTDDLREAPSLTIIELLIKAGARLRLYDPVSQKKAQKILDSSSLVTFCENEQTAATGADAICLITEWKQFRFLDLTTIKKVMKGNAFFDGRNQYEPEEMNLLGFEYFGVGIPPSNMDLLKELTTRDLYASRFFRD